jgi:hypothetical protein
MRWGIWLLGLGVTGLAVAADGPPPPGWRFPTGADYRGRWVEYRDTFPVPFHVSGDFNGDGVVDHAWILIREGRVGFGFFVFLGRRDARPRVIEVFSDDECCAQTYALALVPPGRHLTVCGRGAECSPGEPRSVTLKYPGVEFITLGAASALFYWSPIAKGFRSVPVAD